MSDVLVAGKSGQLAQALAHVSETPLHFRGAKDHDFFDIDATARLIDQLGIKTLINTAAYTAVDQAESEPEAAYRLNAELPKAIAKACKLTDTKLLHISTDYVFDGEKPIDEYYTPQDTPNPINIYGQTKLDGERAVLDANDAASIIRTSWVISAFGKNFMTTMMTLMAQRDHLSIVNDQWGTPTQATDLAQRLLSNSAWNHLDHFASDRQKTWFTLAEEIKEDNDFTCTLTPIPTSEYPTAAKRGTNTSLETAP